MHDDCFNAEVLSMTVFAALSVRSHSRRTEKTVYELEFITTGISLVVHLFFLRRLQPNFKRAGLIERIVGLIVYMLVR